MRRTLCSRVLCWPAPPIERKGAIDTTTENKEKWSNSDHRTNDQSIPFVQNPNKINNNNSKNKQQQIRAEWSLQFSPSTKKTVTACLPDLPPSFIFLAPPPSLFSEAKFVAAMRVLVVALAAVALLASAVHAKTLWHQLNGYTFEVSFQVVAATCVCVCVRVCACLCLCECVFVFV